MVINQVFQLLAAMCKIAASRAPSCTRPSMPRPSTAAPPRPYLLARLLASALPSLTLPPWPLAPTLRCLLHHRQEPHPRPAHPAADAAAGGLRLRVPQQGLGLQDSHQRLVGAPPPGEGARGQGTCVLGCACVRKVEIDLAPVGAPRRWSHVEVCVWQAQRQALALMQQYRYPVQLDEG